MQWAEEVQICAQSRIWREEFLTILQSSLEWQISNRAFSLLRTFFLFFEVFLQKVGSLEQLWAMSECLAQGGKTVGHQKGTYRGTVSTQLGQPWGLLAFSAPCPHHSHIFPDGLLQPYFLGLNLESLSTNKIPDHDPARALSYLYQCRPIRYLDPTDAETPRSSCFKPQEMWGE